MANKNAVPPKDKQFKKGNNANPRGSHAHSPLSPYKKITLEHYREMIDLVYNCNLEQVSAIAKDPTSSSLKVALASCLVKAIKTGDYSTVEKMIERIVGKIPEELNLRAKNLNTNINTIVDKATMKEVLKELEEDV